MQPSLKPPAPPIKPQAGWPPQIHLGIYIGLLFLLMMLFNLGTSVLPATEDVTYYYEYSRKIMSGLMPYRDFGVEYPPIALLFFLLPWLVLYPAGGLRGEFFESRDAYAVLFHIECFALQVAVLLLAYRLLCKLYPAAAPVSFMSRLIWYTLGSVAISLYLLQRFDIGAAFLLLLGLYWIYDNKPGWAGIALGLGTAAKLYPAVALPLVLLYLWRYRSEGKAALRCLAGFAGAGLLTALPFLLISPDGFLAFLKYHSERGIQIESFYGVIAAAGHYLNFYPASSTVDHVSIGVASPISGLLATFATLLTVGGLLVIYWLAFRKLKPGAILHTDWLIQATALAVIWFILANKVFSPQYMVWLLAFVPFWTGRKQIILLLALILSFVPFPLLAAELFQLDYKPMAVLFIRNSLLVVILFQLWQVSFRQRPKEEC